MVLPSNSVLNGMSKTELIRKIKNLEYARKQAWAKYFVLQNGIVNSRDDLPINCFTRLFELIPAEHRDCPICLELVSASQVQILNCSHFFHFQCLGQIVGEKVCPMCRKPF